MKTTLEIAQVLSEPTYIKTKKILENQFKEIFKIW